jgi:putative DNA primase/helicase
VVPGSERGTKLSEPKKKQPRPKSRPRPKPKKPVAAEPGRNGVGYHTDDYVPPPAVPTAGGGAIEGVSYAEIQGQDLRYLLADYVPRDMPTLIGGPSDAGKTTWMCALAAYCQGEVGPLGQRDQIGQAVMWMSVEEDAYALTRPKLVAAGCDLRQIVSPLHTRQNQIRETVTLPSGLPRLIDVGKRWKIGLLVIDPITSFLDRGFDLRDPAQIRHLLEQLTEALRKLEAACCFTVHNRKGREGSALDRIGGMATWTQIPRQALCFGSDPDVEDGRVMAVGRSAASAKPASLRYRIVGQPGKGRVEMLGSTEVTAAELGGAPTELGESDAHKDARMLLVTLLDMEDTPAREIQRQAQEAGITLTSLRKAKQALRVDFRQTWSGGANVWYWCKPAHGWPSEVLSTLSTPPPGGVERV